MNKSPEPEDIKLCQLAAITMESIISNTDNTLSRNDRIKDAEIIGDGILSGLIDVDLIQE